MSPNLFLSYSVSEDKGYKKMGCIFVGCAYDSKEKEVHVWLKKGMRTSETVPCNKCLEGGKPK